LIVERNDGTLSLHGNGVHTKEVVVNQNIGTFNVNNNLDRMEIKTNKGAMTVYGDISEHIDVKVGGGSLNLKGPTSSYDVWVGRGCL